MTKKPAVTLPEVVKIWLQENRPHSHWAVERLSSMSIITGYNWWFGIYNDYITSGYGIDRNGNRYNENLLIEAADPEFFKKLAIVLDTVIDYRFTKDSQHPFEIWHNLGIDGKIPRAVIATNPIG